MPAASPRGMKTTAARAGSRNRRRVTDPLRARKVGFFPNSLRIFRTDAHAGRGATADENVIARSVLCDEAISFVDGEIASQTALAMTGGGDFQNRPLWIDSRNNVPSLLTDGIASFSLIWRLSEQIQESS